jgi:hypothetical protein
MSLAEIEHVFPSKVWELAQTDEGLQARLRFYGDTVLSLTTEPDKRQLPGIVEMAGDEVVNYLLLNHAELAEQ